ncbi:MAG: hypothetical protein JXB85_15730 [Anaerolineales bacterium]|nr:hypothetical protein [Anaerolineales bacterium]
MPETDFDALQRFILPDYSSRRPFSSFLPGIAGRFGIPLWVFYVNRGQGITSFGVESKDHAILEFQTANRAYQATSLLGFRTFLNGQRGHQAWAYEPFSAWTETGVRRTMFIGLNELEIQEVHAGLGLQVNVLYFILPQEPFAGLVRRVTIRNLGDGSLACEVLDGLPAVVPYGVDNGTLKHIGRTIEAWMEVTHHMQGLPFYRLKATSGDSLDVRAIEAGNLAFGFLDGALLPVVVDPVAAFGPQTDLAFPAPFRTAGLQAVLEAAQITQGRTPCALFGTALELAAGEARTITSLYGHSPDLDGIRTQLPRLLAAGVVEAKLEQARQLTCDLTAAIETSSASPVFDAYCRQTYLDNLMRGGAPLLLGGKHIYHLYSRKHGDIERDYNHFVLAPEFYSQGNGNYRDVNQNRRNDVFFFPPAGEFNLRQFLSLIQADGYNPLVVEGTCFRLAAEHRQQILALAAEPAPLAELLSGDFTPGQLLAVADRAGIGLPPEEFIERVLGLADQHIRAVHGEGYWIDHWTYNLDLIEAALAVFPERKQDLLFDSEPLPFYDSAARVRPRAERYILGEGRPRQVSGVVHDDEKAALIASRPVDPHWARSGGGRGEVFRLPVASKLALLALIKFASLDPSGCGIQMEAGRPGWYDALNGLPGLFGSSMAETFELLRLVDFLLQALDERPGPVDLPMETRDLLQGIRFVLDKAPEPFHAWERLSTALEAYRASTRLGFDGAVESLALGPLLAGMRHWLQAGIARAEACSSGLPPTYFVHAVSAYDLTGAADPENRPYIRARAFESRPLPAFLEGPVRQMKTLDPAAAADLHARVRASDLFDHRLGMYRVNASLEDQPHEIGRARAFTPGWLENGSIWMHMAFKYLLELLKAGLFPQFFADLKTGLPAFLDPAVYGRSPLENSSFIVSSAHPDASLHGNGFVARLSGSTAEFLSLWVQMTAGRHPFRLQDGELVLELHPSLPAWLFKADGTFSFRFLGSCEIRYHNPDARDTFAPGMTPKRVVLQPRAGEAVTLEGAVIPAPYARMVREGLIESIGITF